MLTLVSVAATLATSRSTSKVKTMTSGAVIDVLVLGSLYKTYGLDISNGVAQWLEFRTLDYENAGFESFKSR